MRLIHRHRQHLNLHSSYNHVWMGTFRIFLTYPLWKSAASFLTFFGIMLSEGPPLFRVGAISFTGEREGKKFSNKTTLLWSSCRAIYLSKEFTCDVLREIYVSISAIWRAVRYSLFRRIRCASWTGLSSNDSPLDRVMPLSNWVSLISTSSYGIT